MLKRIVISLLLILGAAASCGVTAKRGEIPPGPKVIEEYQPGQPRPGQGYCSWSYHDYDESYCWLDVDRETIYYTIDRRTGQITRTTYTFFREEIQIGTLIVVWGEPEWAYMSYGSVEVGWNDRSAWLITQRFSPRDKVWMITYYMEPPKVKQERWRGFRSQP